MSPVEKKAAEKTKFRHFRRAAGFGEDSSSDFPDDEMPTDPRRLEDWIASQERQLKELRRIEEQFIATGDLELIKPFMSTEQYPGRWKIREPLREKASLFDYESFFEDGKRHGFSGEEYLKKRNEEIKRLFPHVEIRQVTNIDGKPMLAYVGITTEEKFAGLRLLDEEKQKEANIQQGLALLSALSDVRKTTQPDAQTSGMPVSNRTTQARNR
jgi:hypothetical protein